MPEHVCVCVSYINYIAQGCMEKAAAAYHIIHLPLCIYLAKAKIEGYEILSTILCCLAFTFTCMHTYVCSAEGLSNSLIEHWPVNSCKIQRRHKIVSVKSTYKQSYIFLLFAFCWSQTSYSSALDAAHQQKYYLIFTGNYSTKVGPKLFKWLAKTCGLLALRKQAKVSKQAKRVWSTATSFWKK